MHLGLFCPEFSGHLNPMTTLGQELQARGHTVTLIARPDAEQKAAISGLGFLPIGEQDFPRGSVVRSTEELGRLSGRRALSLTVELAMKAVEVSLRDAPAVMEHAGIEGALVDQISPGGALVAERMGIPFVTICNALALHGEIGVPPALLPWRYNPSVLGMIRNRVGYSLIDWLLRPVRRRILESRREMGLPHLEHEYSGSLLAHITQQPAIFDFPRKSLPPIFHYTGPFHRPELAEAEPFPFERLSGKPLIYASLGTLQNRLQWVFRAIAEACEGLDAQLVISLGVRGRAIPQGFAGSPVVVSYAPQLELLQRASLVITHAGLNTALETLSQGVPMVAIPITNDQPGVAARIAYLGVGEMAPLRGLTARKLRKTITKVLSAPNYRQRAQEAQEQIRRVDGLAFAADIAEKALRSNEPVRFGGRVDVDGRGR